MDNILGPKTPNVPDSSLKNKDNAFMNSSSWSMGLASDAPQETPLPKELLNRIENNGVFSILRKRQGKAVILNEKTGFEGSMSGISGSMSGGRRSMNGAGKSMSHPGQSNISREKFVQITEGESPLFDIDHDRKKSRTALPTPSRYHPRKSFHRELELAQGRSIDF